MASTAATYGYWSGLPTEGYEWIFRTGGSTGAIPTGDGLVCLFACLPPPRMGRGGADVIRAVAAAAAPSLAERLDAFRRRGIVVNYREGMFLDASWVAVLLGQRVLPEALDPLALRRPLDEVALAEGGQDDHGGDAGAGDLLGGGGEEEGVLAHDLPAAERDRLASLLRGLMHTLG